MISRSDERKQTMYGASRPNTEDDESENEGTEAKAGSDDDEADDEQNETASQGVRAGVTGSGKAREAADEASETSQKSRVMGQAGQKGGGGEGVKMSQEVSDAEEMQGSAHKVLHGRAKPAGKAAEIDGAHQGSGDGGEPRHFSNLGHGEREATISGAHQGQHGGSSDGGKAGEGFEAGGKLGREHARGPTGTKR